MAMSEDRPVDDPDLKILNSKLGDEKFKRLTDQTSLVNCQFKARRKKVREKLLQPPTPTKEDLELLDIEVEENLKTKILIQDDFSSSDPHEGQSLVKRLAQKFLSGPIHPQSGGMTLWYFVLTFCLLYNAYVIPLRVSFTPYQHKESFSWEINFSFYILARLISRAHSFDVTLLVH